MRDVKFKIQFNRLLLVSTVAVMGINDPLRAQEKGPAKLVEYRKLWQETALLQQNHLDQQYLGALEKLIKELTMAGEMENAHMVRKELGMLENQIKRNSRILGGLKDGSISDLRHTIIPQRDLSSRTPKYAKEPWFSGTWRTEKAVSPYLWLGDDGRCYFCNKVGFKRKDPSVVGKWRVDGNWVRLDYGTKMKARFLSKKEGDEVVLVVTELGGENLGEGVKLAYFKVQTPAWVQTSIEMK